MIENYAGNRPEMGQPLLIRMVRADELTYRKKVIVSTTLLPSIRAQLAQNLAIAGHFWSRRLLRCFFNVLY